MKVDFVFGAGGFWFEVKKQGPEIDHFASVSGEAK
jgi:hypothetical protein